ncbi:hypothetical protein QR98_0055110 [Sarcoptes scabiei]|uniref:Uncharacterized protein n=1 Tax=Sarcoptes scabiei TaxID=52283 RepID=A0A132A833_SARSC|nr:hypothetical protein QR98_0055110 [Sarcoptes scabiei]
MKRRNVESSIGKLRRAAKRSKSFQCICEFQVFVGLDFGDHFGFHFGVSFRTTLSVLGFFQPYQRFAQIQRICMLNSTIK